MPLYQRLSIFTKSKKLVLIIVIFILVTGTTKEVILK